MRADQLSERIRMKDTPNIDGKHISNPTEPTIRMCKLN